MRQKSIPAPSPDQPMGRELVNTLLNTALSIGELRYARRLSNSWLTYYPGDLPIRLIQAHAYNNDTSRSVQSHTLQILEELCKVDPEFSEAQELLADVRHLAGTANHLVPKACATALSHAQPLWTSSNERLPSWAKSLYEAHCALNNMQAGEYQQIEKAEYFIHKALIEKPDTPLTAVLHLRTLDYKKTMPKLAIRNLAEIYHDRWPDCLQFTLTLSKELLETGETDKAVEMLHDAISKDTIGLVPKRMWGEKHPYRHLWPKNLEVPASSPNSPQSIPIPAAIASILGWNRLSAMNSDVDYSVPDNSLFAPQEFNNSSGKVPIIDQINLPEVDTIIGDTVPPSASAKIAGAELEQMAAELMRPHIAHEDGRFPIYVIFTTLKGLSSQYEEASIQRIDAELKKLARILHGYKVNQEHWGSLIFYADVAASTQPYGLQPAPYNDPEQLKLSISNLDAALGKRGERIGALLIIGGPEIVPFHNLPNPVEDADSEVPSDNPYSAKDNNYFISDWPVGRVSGGSGNDSGDLVSILKEITKRHDQKTSKPAWYLRLISFFREFLKTGVSKKLSSFGYTAAVWQRASLSVFRSIGHSADLLVSPPVHACDSTCNTCNEYTTPLSNGNTCLILPDTRLAYFNLHGVPDAAEWYGQSDPTLPEDGPEFPVAIRPRDIRNSGSAPHMVFSEACYGANIIDKRVDEAISLKFLASGTQAVVGSTCISYGSLSTPLSSADLLGRIFWNHLQEGFPAGESLRRAKIQLTREMNSRQGFLDAEDQKTLISFVLFGDPLAQPFKPKVSPKINPHLSDAAVPVRTVCERSCDGEVGSSVPLETISHLKSIVAQYLPGMNDAQVNLYHEHQTCANLCGHCGTGKPCRLSQASAKNQNPIKSQRRVVTLSKNFEREKRTHRQYARLTLDERGKIVKMVVSH